jgi:hypothetical protein
MPDAPVIPDEPGTDLERLPAFALDRAPILDSLNKRQLELLKARSPGLKDAELAAALELAWSYKLDPYANEIWFTRGKAKDGGEGKLLIMVGRDGLRKVAQRNHLSIDCDVVREKDTFSVKRGPDRAREVSHSYQGSAEERGPIVGAWAEVWDLHGKQRGFFYAPLSEYKPASASQYSPWSKQTSVMLLAAAERQAIRQATPLGGLLVEGEDELVGSAAPAEQPVSAWIDNERIIAAVEEVLATAERLGHAGLSDRATVEMTLRGQPEDFVLRWVVEAMDTLEGIELLQPAPIPDAEVEPEPAGLEATAAELRDSIAEAEDAEEAAALAAELEAVEANLEASNDPAQESLGL